MEQAKGTTFTVPVMLYFTDDGVLSVNISIHSEYDSPLVKMLQNKTVDESKSVIGVFARNTLYAKSFVMFSGMFNFTDKATYVSPEEINQRVMQALAEQLVKASDNPCEYCTNRDKCNGEAWQEPDSDVCARHVIQYYFDKVKND